MNMRKISKGDKVVVFYKSNGWNDQIETKCEFLGFTDNTTKYSETPVYANWMEVQSKEGVKTFKELEVKQDTAGNEYGHHFYAVFKDLEEREATWCAYLHNGRWVLGSSCTKFSVRVVDE